MHNTVHKMSNSNRSLERVLRKVGKGCLLRVALWGWWSHRAQGLCPEPGDSADLLQKNAKRVIGFDKSCKIWTLNMNMEHSNYQRKFRNLTSDYTESCCWRSVNQEMWSRSCDTAEMWDMRIWRVGSVRNAVFFRSFVASPAGKVSS